MAEHGVVMPDPAGRSPATLLLVLATALALAPLVRGTTAEIGRNLGQVWPFALTHCHVGTTPGCTLPAHATVLATR